MDILCLGLVVADVVASPVKEFPEKGKLILVDNMELHSGGCAVNTGITLKRLGVDTGVMGKVGDDGFGEFLINVLKKEGLDTEGIKKEKESHTSSTMVIVDPDGERRFIHFIGTNGKFSLKDISWEIISKCKILHVAGAMLMPSFDGKPLSSLMKKAKEMGKITSLDTAWDFTGKWLSLIEDSLPYVDYFLPSLEEAKMLSGMENPRDIAQFFLKRGVKVVGLKMGDKGSYVTDGKNEVISPAYKIEVIDTTGAGDAFAGGFLLGVLEGWDINFTSTFANACGAFAAQSIGATSGIKSRKELLQFIKRG